MKKNCFSIKENRASDKVLFPYSFTHNSGIMYTSNKTYSIRYLLTVLVLLSSAFQAAAQIRVDSVQCICPSGGPGSISLIAEGSAGPFTFLWGGPGGYLSTEQNPADLPAPGQYSVTVTNAYGCAVTLEAEVSECDGVPEVELEVEAACVGAANGSASITFPGGNTGYTFAWSNGETQSSLSGLAAGSLSVTVTNAAGCRREVDVQIPEENSLMLTAQIFGECFQQSAGGIDLSVNGGQAPYIFQWNNGSSQEDLGPVDAGLYKVTVTDETGCTALADFTVPQHTPPDISGMVQLSSCANNADGSIQINITNGTAPFNYEWNNGATTEDISNLSGGIYILTVTDDNGCYDQAGFNTMPTTPQDALPYLRRLRITAIHTSTAEETLIYDAEWIEAVGDCLFFLPNEVDIAHTVFAQIKNGLRSLRFDAEFSEPMTPSPSMFFQNTSFFQGILVGGNAWMFLMSVGDAASMVQDGRIEETFIFMGMDLRGNALFDLRSASNDMNACAVLPRFMPDCIWSPPVSGNNADDVHTLRRDCMALTFAVNHNNNSASASTLGGVAPISWFWEGPDGFTSTNQQISGVAPGRYCLTAEDANGCRTIECIEFCKSLDLLVSDLLLIMPPCPGQSDGMLCLQTDEAFQLLVSWPDGSDELCMSGVAAGQSYCFEVTELRCMQTVEHCTDPVMTVSGVGLTLTSARPACPGQMNGHLMVRATGGRAPYAFTWASGQSGSTATGLAAGICHAVTVTDDCGQSFSTCFTLPTAPPLNITNVVVNNACGDTPTGSILLQLTGLGPLTIQWKDKRGEAVGGNQSFINQLFPGPYSVEVTDACGQTVSMFIDVGNTNTETGITMGDPVITPACAGQGGGVDISVQSPPAFPPSFLWSNGATTEDILHVAPGEYSVTVTNAFGCQVVQFAEVPNVEVLVDATITPATCQRANGSILLNAEGGQGPYTFLWSNGATTPLVSGLSAGNYFATITENGGCSTTITVQLHEDQSAQLINSFEVQNSCGAPTGSILITAVADMEPVTFLWDSGVMGPLNSGLVPGEYCVIAMSALGCVEAACFEVEQIINDLSIIVEEVRGAHPDYIEGTGFIDISVEGGLAPFSFLWSTGWTGEDLYQIFPGDYTVTVTSANGCSTSIAVEVPACSNAPLTLSCFPYDVTPIGPQGGSIRVNVNGGTPTHQYEWFGPNGQIPTAHYILDQISVPGNYCLVVRDQCGQFAPICRPMILEEDCPTSLVMSLEDSGCEDEGVLVFDRLFGATQVHIEWSTNQTSLFNLNSNGYISSIIYGPDRISADPPVELSVYVTDEKGCVNTASFFVGGAYGFFRGLSSLDIDQHLAAFGFTYNDFINAINPPITPITPVPISGFRVCEYCTRVIRNGSVSFHGAGDCLFAEFAFSANPEGVNPFAENICQRGGRINCFGPTASNRFSWRVPPNFEGIYVEPGLGPVFECGCLFPLSIMDEMPPFQYQNVIGYHGELWLYARICGSDYGEIPGTPINPSGGISIGGNTYNCPSSTNCDICRAIEAPTQRCNFNVVCIVFDRDSNGNILETYTTTIEHSQIQGNIKYVKRRVCYTAGEGPQQGCDCAIWQICDTPCNPWSRPVRDRVLLNFDCENNYMYFPDLELSTDDMEMWDEPCMDVAPGFTSDEELEFRQPENHLSGQAHVSVLANPLEGTFVTAYPNPFDQKLNIQFSTTTHSSWQVRLFQLSGQLILEKELHPDAGNAIYEFEVGNLILPGVYLLSITDHQGRRYMQKVVKIAGQ